MQRNARGSEDELRNWKAKVWERSGPKPPLPPERRRATAAELRRMEAERTELEGRLERHG